MSELINLQDMTAALSKPYAVTRSKLGATTKVIDEKFICTSKELKILFSSLGEKVSTFQPSKAGFQYLISFTDSTHYENSNLDTLTNTISTSNKKTDKLILNWRVAHEYDGVENEMSITVRISNPMNPFVMLQAAMSADHGDADRLDFEDGAVSVSINGATQNTAEEIFAIVTRWAQACPQPQSITGINQKINKNSEKISFLNYWVFPVLYTVCAFYYLKNTPQETVTAYSLVAFVGFMLIRGAAQHINNLIEKWGHFSQKFSLFMITGGDSNQQTKMAAKSRNSTLKLVCSVILSFGVNIAAGLVLTKYIAS